VPQRPSVEFPDSTYHVVNRAIYGQLLCRDFGEYLTFRRILAYALSQVPVDLYAYALMPNHWHLLVRAKSPKQLAAFIHLLSMIHGLELRRWRGSVGRGAVYQGRYWATVVHDDTYFYRVVRYVERNPVRAGLVDRASEWLWSSASPTGALQGIVLAEWPLPRPANWSAFVDEVEPARDLDFIRKCTRRGRRIIEPSTDAATPAYQPVRVRAIRDMD
jgi:putative transposase